MKLCLVFFLLAIALCVPQVLFAGYEEGAAASRKGLYKEALKEFRKAAEQGDVKSQYSLAVMFHDGIGVEKNMVEARRWFDKAARQGHPGARQILKHLAEPQSEKTVAPH